eukprot:NODE_4466_length_783_cov_9.503049_g4307_i0.p1 GENE.NODE_4466_length_783_cov_9.503049_g4307_i0~~NODE_4466_length_783_cov_9.503049_g4307_i0.p1  ORF type:complete len:237 (+),score=51.67 NODE_4466_length_783_cov_9.503049_g4307_i0:81-713(+)
MDKLYSSFNTGGKSTMPVAKRQLAYGQQFAPSKYQPIGPSPCSYNVVVEADQRGAYIPKAIRKSAPSEDPSRGKRRGHSAANPQPSHSQSPTPTNSKVTPFSKCPRFPEAKQSRLGPQTYDVSHKLVTTKTRAPVFSKTSRFPPPGACSSPGPGAYNGRYPRPFNQSYSMGRSGGQIESTLPCYRSLKYERKSPGPGHYSLDGEGDEYPP